MAVSDIHIIIPPGRWNAFRYLSGNNLTGPASMQETQIAFRSVSIENTVAPNRFHLIKNSGSHPFSAGWFPLETPAFKFF